MASLQTPTPVPPWTVRTAKRRTPSSAPGPGSGLEPGSITSTSRKRQRVSADSVRRTKKRPSQQTLTQIPWAPKSLSVSFGAETEDGLDYIDRGDNKETVEGRFRSKSTEPKRRRSRGSEQARAAVKKKNSTLTQMDFFHSGLPEVELDEGYLVDDQDARDASGDGSTGPQQQPDSPGIPQMDGAHDSPRKPRLKRLAGTALGEERYDRRALPADGDYRPSKKKKRITAAENEHRTRRSSARVRMKVLSDPAQNLDYFSMAFADDPRPPPAVLKGRPQRPKLEIQDTMDSESVEVSVQPSQAPGPPSTTPKTPRRRREVVPSSQSPDSLPPSTRERSVINLVTPGEIFPRAPLREMSVNISSAHHLYTNSDDKIPSFQPTASPSPKHKICVLKLPKKAPQNLKSRVENSQTDIWSIQPSSSQRSQKRSPYQLPPPPVQWGESENGKEIPETSQNHLDLSKNVGSSSREEESLQSLSAIFGTARRREDTAIAIEPEYASSLDTSRELGVIVSDFAAQNEEGLTPTQLRSQQEVAPSLQEDPQLVVGIPRASSGDVQNEDYDSAFGTPIANDTLFDAELTSRVPASPIPLAALRSPERPQDVDASNTTGNSAADTAGETAGERGEHDSGSFPLPPPALVHYSTTTIVPLNDIVPSSSSPVLPPMRTTTQRSVHPASLPHQSQISTQEPTQHYPPMSSLPLYNVPGMSQDGEPDRITIKDSSSTRLSMSQVPMYNDEGDESGLDVDLDLDDYHTEGGVSEDDDLERDAEIESEDEDLGLVQPFVLQSFQHPNPLSQSVSDSVSATRNPQRNHLQQPSGPPAKPSQRQFSPPQPSQEAEVESNFTQGGHVTASRIARMKAQGLIPQDYVPRADFRVPTDSRELLPAWAFEGLESSDEDGVA